MPNLLFTRPLHAATYQTLIGLTAVTGMRLGEAIRLDCDDVDARNQLLRIIGWPAACISALTSSGV